MIYQFVPLYAIGVISREEIQQFENHILRNEMKFPNSISGKLINNIISWYRDPIAKTIDKIYQKEHHENELPKFTTSSLPIQG